MGAQYSSPLTPATYYTIEVQSNARPLNYVLGTTDVSEFFKVAYIDYPTSGSTELTMPSRASYISVILIGGGGGGGGGGGTSGNANRRGGGGGGAGAALVSKAFSVASGSQITISVGAGGTGGTTTTTGTNGVGGGSSSLTIDGVVKFSVNGGAGGTGGVSGGTSGGAGGTGGTIPAIYLTDPNYNNSVSGGSGVIGTGAGGFGLGGNGGSRDTLNNASPAYCENYIATGVASSTGTGSGAGGAGGTGGTSGSASGGNAGFARIYFYI